MKIAQLRSEMLDRLGVLASMACAVHCVIGVVVASSAGAWRIFGDERVELQLVLVALLIAGVSIGSGFRRHRKWAPPGLLALGVVLVILARTVAVGETILSVAGATVLIATHLSNLRALRMSRPCC